MPARVTLARLRSSLAQGTPEPAYYIHGAEALLKQAAVSLLIDRALDPSLRDFNLDLLSAQQLEPDALAAACATLPMMAERRVVVLRDVEAWKRKSKAKLPALAYLDRPAPETVLVIVQGNDDDPDDDIAGRCVAVACDPLSGPALDDWLTAALAEQGVTLAPDAREHLARATAGDLGLLSAEIEKLAGLESGTVIDRDTVGALVGVRFGETVDDWRDAVLRDDTARAVALIPRLLSLSGTSGVRLVTFLGSSLLLLAWARATAEQRRLRDRALADAVKQLCFSARPGVGSYDPVARLVAEVVGQWPTARLRGATRAALAADVALKTTTISDEAGIVTDLVLALGASRTARAA